MLLPRSVKNSSKELSFHRCFVVVLDCIGPLHVFYMNYNVIEYHTVLLHIYTVCPTRYRTRRFFNNFTTNEDIATKFEVDLPRCVRNVTTS